MIQQVSKELIASFKDTECNNMVASHILHDISSQTFCPGRKKQTLISVKCFEHQICLFVHLLNNVQALWFLFLNNKTVTTVRPWQSSYTYADKFTKWYLLYLTYYWFKSYVNNMEMESLKIFEVTET